MAYIVKKYTNINKSNNKKKSIKQKQCTNIMNTISKALNVIYVNVHLIRLDSTVLMQLNN